MIHCILQSLKKVKTIFLTINPILVEGRGGQNCPPDLNLEKNLTHFMFYVLHDLSKKTGIIGLSKEKFLDFVGGRS